MNNPVEQQRMTTEGTLRHVYDGVQCIADIDENNVVIASYTWGSGIDNLLAIHIGGETYYPLTDVQGTVWGYVDANNNIVARYEYDAWGNILSSTSSIPALARNRYRFQGREWSAAMGLTNFRARWYDAETGRWLSKDPIGLNGGLNLYAFCGNDPVGKIDPLGTITPLIGAIVGAAIGGVSGYLSSGGNLLNAGAGAVGGLVGGFIAVATGNGALGGAVAGFITSAILEYSKGDNGSVGAVTVSTMGGALFGGIGGVLGNGVGGLSGEMIDSAFPGLVGGFTDTVIGFPRQVDTAIKCPQE